MSYVKARRIVALLATTSICVLATAASAQTNRTVTVQTNDGSVSLSGELLGVVDQKYHLKTAMGEMYVDVETASCTGSACPSTGQTFITGEEVTLTSPDRTINLTGTLVKVDDASFTISTNSFGKLKVGRDRVECEGVGCPTTAQPQVAAQAEAPAIEIDTDDARVRFAGSDTVGLGLLPYLMADYAEYLDATVETTDLSETETYKRYLNDSGREITSLFANSTGSGDATDGLEAGAVEFGMTSRPMKDKEAARLVAAGLGDPRNTPNETVIAVDSLAVITHPTNPVQRLSMQQIGAIYLGRITNWSQVGGPDAPITVLSREDGSSTRGVFEKAVFNGDEPPLAARVTYPGGDNPEMAEAVRNDPAAIGYVGFAYSEGLNRLDLTSECGITSTATSFAVKTEEYPLGRRLYLYNTPNSMTRDAQRFLQYVLSPEADDAIAESSFINFAVERKSQPRSRYDNLYRDLNNQSEIRAANEMRDELDNWDRLSTTVRFPTGSSSLGKKELNDIERLVSYLEDLPNGTSVAIVGFADSVGPFDSNVRLSDRRAQAVAQTIR